jgi:hypothetical protein
MTEGEDGGSGKSRAAAVAAQQAVHNRVLILASPRSEAPSQQQQPVHPPALGSPQTRSVR